MLRKIVLPKIPTPKTVRVVMLSLVVVLFFALVAVYLFGKNSHDEASLPCTGQIISRYNDVIRAKDKTTYESGLRLLAEDIKSLEGYREDITCTYILYDYYSDIRDTDNTGEYISAYETLSNEGATLDSGIAEPDSLTMMKDKLRGFDPSPQQNDAGGRG